MDRQPPRRAFGDARGQPRGEKLSEYFDFVTWPEKADRKVTRQELLALLNRQWQVTHEMRWHRRLWRYLTSRRGSGPNVVGATTTPDQE